MILQRPMLGQTDKGSPYRCRIKAEPIIYCYFPLFPLCGTYSSSKKKSMPTYTKLLTYFIFLRKSSTYRSTQPQTSLQSFMTSVMSNEIVVTLTDTIIERQSHLAGVFLAKQIVGS